VALLLPDDPADFSSSVQKLTRPNAVEDLVGSGLGFGAEMFGEPVNASFTGSFGNAEGGRIDVGTLAGLAGLPRRMVAFELMCASRSRSS